MTRTESQVRQQFAAYFLDLQESAKAEGYKVGKASEWEMFIARMIEDGEVPEEAANWKFPRKLTAQF